MISFNHITRAVSAALDPDRALQLSMEGLIETAALRHALGRSPSTWSPGQPLKLYLAGYVGARNTGADVRVEEMVRQLRHIVGDEQLELTLPAFDRSRCAGYFRAVRHQTLPVVFPRFLFNEVPKHHGVVACEGSMFKSKFSNALSTMMAGALGLASAEGKLSVGYGAEAGAMDRSLESFVAKQCRQSFILCRNDESRQVLDALGIRTAPGADTAWTFDPGPVARGADILREHGWDGERPVLGVAPINPFWWPVRPDVFKAATRALTGEYNRDHYKSVYFHHRSAESERKYQAYLDGLAQGVGAFAEETGAFVVLIGMEALDRIAATHLAERMTTRPPLLVSDEYDMFDLVAVLRNLNALLSSRFHAIVCSMPAGVPSGGVTMDERIHNLLVHRGDEDLMAWVDQEDLGERVLTILRRLQSEREAIVERTYRAVPQHLALMGAMGRDFAQELRRVYPELELGQTGDDPWAYLPPLSPDLTQLVETYA